MKSSFLKQLVPRSPVPCVHPCASTFGAARRAPGPCPYLTAALARAALPRRAIQTKDGFNVAAEEAPLAVILSIFSWGRVQFRKALLISLRFKGGNSNPAVLFLHSPDPPGWDFSTFPLSGVGCSYGTAKAASGVYFSWEFVLWPWSARG